MPVKGKVIPRDVSWLSFNARVLQEAADPTVPLQARIRFLGIFSNNLDEFFPRKGGDPEKDDPDGKQGQSAP